jgi:hypothetical protein
MDMNGTNIKGSGSRRLVIGLLFGIPLLILLGKLPILPTAALFTQMFSLADLPARMQGRLEYVMFIPLSAVVVVLFRLTLGIQVFGLFRPILLAIAFRITGLELGLVFLALVMTSIVLIRPVLRIAGMHSYAREAVALGAVVVVMLVTIAASTRAHAESIFAVARFPIISLCLISEHFAKALYEKGVRTAAWRGSMTVLVGVLICLLGRIPGLMHLFVRFPELLIAQIGCVAGVAEFLNLRLFEKRWQAKMGASGPPQDYVISEASI